MSKKRKMLLLTLIGFMIPFSNIIAPCFISRPTLPDIKFRKSLTIIEALITIIPLIISVSLLVWAMKSAGAEPVVDASDITKAIIWLFLTPIGIVATIIALWRRAKQ